MTPRDSTTAGMTGSRRWFRLLLGLYPPEFRDEMGDELVATYLSRAREARARGGLAPAALWGRALIDSLRNGLAERVNPASAWRRGRGWGRDAHLVVRRLRRSPSFTLSILGTLTVGLGAFAVVYSVVHQVLIAPLPYEEPDDLYYVWRDYRAVFDLDRGWLAGTDVVELAGAAGVIEDAVGLAAGRATLTGAGDSRPVEIQVMLTTPNLLEVLGVEPLIGRGFAPDDGGETGPQVAVLGHSLWVRLGADESILGQEIRLDDDLYTVIGVMAPGFDFLRHGSLGPPRGADAYITFDYDLATTSPGAGSYGGLIRSRDGTPPEAVANAVDAVGRAIDERDFDGRGLEWYPVPLKPDLVADVRPALVVVGLAGGFLVLVLLVNLAALLLVRTMERQKELAVSRALGASGSAFLRATMFEGALLGLAGGAAGAAAAVWGTRALISLAPPELPRLGEVAVTWQIGLTVAAVGLLLGLVAAFPPAVWARRARLSSLLSAAALRGGGARGRARRAMVVVQIALSLVLLTAGGLVVRSFSELLRADPGFEAEGVLTFRVPIHDAAEFADALPRQEEIRRELAAIPGVTSVGAVSALPLSGNGNQSSIEAPGAPGNTGEEEVDRPLVDYLEVRPGYFESIGMRILEGEAPDTSVPEGPADAYVDQHVAGQFWPGRSPVGAEILIDGTPLRVVGVVRQARLYDVHEDGRPQIYIRNQREDWGYTSLSYAVRTTRDPSSLTPEVRAAVARVDPRLAVSEIVPMHQLVAESLAQQRVSAVLIAGFALGALLLASMGVFGVVSGSVTRRRQELAVRLAIGADHGRVLRHVLGEGLLLVLAGLLAGAPGVYFGGRVIRGMLVGVSPWDPLTLVAVALGLGVIALAASWIPARRVTRIEPAGVLRQG